MFVKPSPAAGPAAATGPVSPSKAKVEESQSEPAPAPSPDDYDATKVPNTEGLTHIYRYTLDDFELWRGNEGEDGVKAQNTRNEDGVSFVEVVKVVRKFQ